MVRIARAALAAAALIALGASSVTAAPTAPTGTPIVIGAVLSITGNYAPLGEPERNALKVAEAEINASGGIAGHPLSIKILDDEGKPDTAQQLATQLVGEHVAAIIGGTLTPTTLAMTRVTNDAKIVEIYMNPTDSLWNTKNGVMKYLFESTPRNELEATKLMGYLKNTLKRSKIAIMHDEAPYGSTGAPIVAAVAKSVGLDVVDDESYPVAATDMTAQLQKAMKAGADALVIWTAGPAAPILVRQAKQFGFKGTIIGSTGIASDNFLKISGRDGYDVYADLDLNYTHPDPGQRKFLDLYRKAYHARPSNFASFAWDAAHLLALAIGKTKGDVSGDALSVALTTMRPYHGTTGDFKFTATDHNGLKIDAVKMCIEHGAWVVIE